MTDREYFNRMVRCGQFPVNKPGESPEAHPEVLGCGESNWTVRIKYGGQVNVRILVCNHCGLETAVTYCSADANEDDFGVTPSSYSN